MPRTPLSITIITKNESGNLPVVLESVKGWAQDILVVDGQSTDSTREIAQNHGARVLENPWSGFGQQKNFAQKNAEFDWVLNLDADEALTPELKQEIDHQLEQDPTPRVFSIPRKNHYLGIWIRFGGWYPNRLTRLGHRTVSSWTEPPVHESLEPKTSDIKTVELQNPILHYGFKSIQDQIETNARYSRLGALALLEKGKSGSIGLLILKPIGKFFETYLLKQGFRDGLAGFIISVNAAYSVFMKYSFLLEERIKAHANSRR